MIYELFEDSDLRGERGTGRVVEAAAVKINKFYICMLRMHLIIKLAQ